ncbi:MAG: fibronectin type III domain-containing protein [Gammaproteobacteria bacterium]
MNIPTRALAPPAAPPAFLRMARGVLTAAAVLFGASAAHAQSNPTAPGSPMLTPTAGAETSSLVFSWTPATTPDSSISFHVVHLREAGGSWGPSGQQSHIPSGVAVIAEFTRADGRNPASDARNTSLTFTNLKSATTYEARIRAGDVDGGIGPWANASATTAEGPPAAPPRIIKVEPRSRALSVLWGEPVRDTQKFKIRWATAEAPLYYLNAGGADGNDVPGGVDARKYSITGLQAGRIYQIQVAAANVVGNTWTQPRSGTPAPDEARFAGRPPSRPDLRRNVRAPSTALDFRWNKASGGPRARASEYIVHLRELPNAYSPEQDANAWPRYAEVRGIGASSSLPPTIVPHAPRVLAPRARARALEVRWAPPAIQVTKTRRTFTRIGSDPTGYRVRWATAAAPATYLNSGRADGDEVPGGAAAREYSVSGLSAGVAYQVAVAAATTAGMTWSPPLAATPLRAGQEPMYGPPYDPLLGRNVFGDGDSMTFFNLKPGVTYEARVRAEDGNMRRSAWTHVVTAVTAGGVAAPPPLLVTLDPADARIAADSEINPECAANRALIACLGILAYGTVRITPGFASEADTPSMRTALRVFPVTPRVRVSGVRVTGGAGQTPQQRLEAVKAARNAASEAAQPAVNAATSSRDPLQIARAVAAQRRAVSAAVNAAYGDGARTFTADRTAAGGLPRNVRALRGAQYAVYGTDYYLSAAEFVLLPDGTITPPFIEVRNLQPHHERDKTARLALFAVSGDKKYNRPGKGVAAEVDIHFAASAPPPVAPQVELYLAPRHEDSSDFGVEINPQQGRIVKKVEMGLAKVMRLKARLHDRHSGDSVAAAADIHLTFGDLPLALVPVNLAREPSTYFSQVGQQIRPKRNSNNDLIPGTHIPGTFIGLPTAEALASLEVKEVIQPPQNALTIRAGESLALSDVFVILPLGYDGVYDMPAPRIVNAAGDSLASEITTLGRGVSLVAARGRGGRGTANSSATLSAGQSVVETQASAAQGGRVGALVPGAFVHARVIPDVAHAHALLAPVSVRADTNTGAQSADSTDFLRRMPDGSFAPLAPGALLNSYRVPISGAPGVGEESAVPVYLRQDGLVEGDETFMFTIANASRAVTIPANGMVALRAHVSAAADSTVTVRGTLVPSRIKRETFRNDLAEKNAALQEYETETLVPSRVNFGISIGVVGGRVVYADSGSTIFLRFTDTTGIGGTGDADGLLTGDELTATSAGWTFAAGEHGLSINGALPGNLQASQFPAAVLDTTVLSMISFADPATPLAVPESGPAIPRLTLLLDPPLKAPAVIRLLASGAASGNTFTANSDGDEFADVHAMREITLPANRGVVVVAVPNIRNDFMVEPRESFQLELPVVSDAPGGVLIPAPGAARKIIEIVDDDVARFRVEPSVNNVLRSRDLRKGQTVTLRGRLDAVVQVGAGGMPAVAEVTITEQLRERESLEFFDADADGYLRGAELASQPLDIVVNFAAEHFDFSAVAIRSAGLAADAFRFPRAADAGREKARWNADLLLASETVVPIFTGASRIVLQEDDLKFFSERALPALERRDPWGADGANNLIVTIPLKLSADFEQTVGVVFTARHDPDGDGPRAPRSIKRTRSLSGVAHDGSGTGNPQFRITLTSDDMQGLFDIDHLLNTDASRTATTTIVFDARTQRIQAGGVALFSDAAVRGPDILLNDNEDNRRGNRTFLRLTLAGADGRPIRKLPAGKRTDAFLKAELYGTRSVVRGKDDAATVFNVAVAVTRRLALEIGFNGMDLADLGYPDIPRRLVIEPGESAALSERAIIFTPTRHGAFGFDLRGVSPQDFGEFGRFRPNLMLWIKLSMLWLWPQRCLSTMRSFSTFHTHFLSKVCMYVSSNKVQRSRCCVHLTLWVGPYL